MFYLYTDTKLKKVKQTYKKQYDIKKTNYRNSRQNKTVEGSPKFKKNKDSILNLFFIYLTR